MRQQKVLVTGGAGFIGSQVVKKLLEKNYSVTVLDNLSKHKTHTLKGVEFHQVDLRDQVQTSELFSGIDVCINLAARIGGIGYFHTYPATIISDNNDIFSSTFTAAVNNGLKRMVYISSSMVYEMAKKFPSKEEDTMHIPPPISAYGFSKLIGEEYCKAFWEEHKLSYTICRPFNAYGENEYPGDTVGYAHVIPDLVKKILSGQYPLDLLGNGKQVRCFTHVSDLAEGIVMAMESDKTLNEAVNIANPTPITMFELAEKIWHLTGQKKPFKVNYSQKLTYDIQKRIPDTSKIEKLTGWKAKISIDEGLRRTISWLENNI